VAAHQGRHDRMHPPVHDELMVRFAHDDAGYRDWLVKHPGGYVINTYMNPSRSYLKLHHVSCTSISRLQRGAKTFTDGEYSKVCGGRAELEAYARQLGGAAEPCPLCL
jgi:hypothetical protein